MTCEHHNFAAHVDVGRLTQKEGGPVTHYCADIRIACADCGVRFEFHGLPVGYSPYRATTNLAGDELSAPIGPPGHKIPEGLPSMSVRVMQPEATKQ